MHILSAKGEPIELELVAERPVAEMVDASPERAFGRAGLTGMVAAATSAFLLSPSEKGLSVGGIAQDAIAGALRRESKRSANEPVAVFREQRSGLARTVKREVVVRFRPGLSERKRRSILKKHGLTVRRHSATVPDQVVVADPGRRKAGVSLIEIANDWATLDEVLFATPNFISEYRRAVTVPEAQWHLENRAKTSGQVAHEDVRALGAWQRTSGAARHRGRGARRRRRHRPPGAHAAHQATPQRTRQGRAGLLPARRPRGPLQPTPEAVPVPVLGPRPQRHPRDAVRGARGRWRGVRLRRRVRVPDPPGEGPARRRLRAGRADRGGDPIRDRERGRAVDLLDRPVQPRHRERARPGRAARRACRPRHRRRVRGGQRRPEPGVAAGRLRGPDRRRRLHGRGQARAVLQHRA